MLDAILSSRLVNWFFLLTRIERDYHAQSIAHRDRFGSTTLRITKILLVDLTLPILGVMDAETLIVSR